MRSLPAKKQPENEAGYAGLVAALVCMLAAVSEPRILTIKTALVYISIVLLVVAVYLLGTKFLRVVSRSRMKRRRAGFRVINGGLNSVPRPLRRSPEVFRDLKTIQGSLSRR